jgi:choline dehydrogenase
VATELILPKQGLQFAPPPPELTSQFDSIKYDPSYWGGASDIFAGWPKFYWPGVTPLLEAFREIEGVDFPPDSGAGQPGVYWFPSFVDPRTQSRSYAQTGHYSNVNTTRPNYHLLINTQVRKILVSDDLTASGVEFPLADSTLVTVTADKEVILSAGAVHSPQLLQLSGIGPKPLLNAGGIKVLVDLPGVGQNFQDHSSLTALNITRKYTQLRRLRRPLHNFWHLIFD